MRIYSIGKYFVKYFSNSDSPSACILLYDTADKFVGQLFFKPNGTTLPSMEISSMHVYTFYYHMDDFQNVIDILRNEKTVGLYAPRAPHDEQGSYIGNPT